MTSLLSPNGIATVIGGDVYLDGSHFHSAIALAGIAVSAASGVAFFLLMWYMYRIRTRTAPHSAAHRYLQTKITGVFAVSLLWCVVRAAMIPCSC